MQRAKVGNLCFQALAFDFFLEPGNLLHAFAVWLRNRIPNLLLLVSLQQGIKRLPVDSRIPRRCTYVASTARQN